MGEDLSREGPTESCVVTKSLVSKYYSAYSVSDMVLVTVVGGRKRASL